MFTGFGRGSPIKNNSETTTAEERPAQHQIGAEFVEVRRLLDQIKIASIKQHGRFSDQDPTRERARQQLRDRVIINDGTEASINRAVADDLFENDILLTLPQANQILQEIKEAPTSSHKRRGRRQANPTPSSIWGSVNIPYVFQLSQTDSNWQNNIRNGQRHIESLTCVRFVFHNSEYALKGKDFLQYFRGTGCWSQVGKTGGRQPISIGYGCESLGIVAHETLHALGLWHEQSRLDRDKFVRINYDSILPGTESNFEKRTPDTSDNMGQPYDLGSAMHYGNKAFTSDFRSFTILTLDRTYQQTIGQRGGLSFKDARMINTRYCSEICTNKLDCEHGGYTDPMNCGQCRCPDGYAGDYCQSIPTSNSEACLNPGEFTAGRWPGSLKTSALVARASCHWRIHPLHEKHRVVLNIEKLDMPCKDSCASFLELKYKKDKIATGARLCCGNPGTIYADIGTDVLVILRSESKLDSKYKGFELTYKSEGDPITITPTAKPIIGVTTPTKTTETPTTKTTTTETTTTETTTTPKTTTTETTTTETTTTETTTTPKTTTTETTEEPPTTTVEEGIWSKWGGWSGCSASCGACGQRRRVRTCFRGKCKGEPLQVERCSFGVCRLTKHRTNRCQGRLVMPCDLLESLEFGTVIKYDGIRQADNDSLGDQTVPMLDSNILLETKSRSRRHFDELTGGNFPTLLLAENADLPGRSRRQADDEMAETPKVFCEKRFSYNCPTTLLTISMDWQQTKSAGNHHKSNGNVDEGDDHRDRECCPGFTPSEGQCVLKGR
uniref:Metalloendopeptidase n=1 Tax=Globodera rostochiensis TaxID=31243 RepID=A0A914HWM0_GLORO